MHASGPWLMTMITLAQPCMHARMADSELMMDGCILSLHGQRSDRVAHIDGAGPPPHAQSPNHTPAIDSDEINHPDKRNKTLI